jgi:hypothetical protein
MQDRTFLTHSGIIPPFPRDKSAEKNSTKNLDGSIEASPDNGKKGFPSKLLSLIRSVEKKEKGSEDYETTIEETVDVFNHLIAVYSRHGLLQGDTEKAEQILSTENSMPSGGRNGKKGKRGNKNGGSDDLRIQQGGVVSSDSTGSTLLEETLIFTTILRVLTPAASNDSPRKMDEDRALLISLAAELCLGICQHIKVDKESDSCNLAEYELLAQSGKPILSCILKTIDMIERDARASTKSRMKDDKCLTLIKLDKEIHVLALNSSMRLAGALVGLFGTKLSRSTALLLNLNAVSWKFLTVDGDSVQESAARLLASLPLAGGIDRKTPSDIWTVQVSDILTALSTALETMAPLTKSSDSGTESTNEFVGQWVNYVRKDINDESWRLKCFYRFSRGLTKTFHYLLLQDGLGQSNSLVDARLDVKKVFAVVESFVSFPLLSETVYYRTKRRLRNEVIDNGLLSPRSIATEVANHIKLMGHKLLDSTMDAVGGLPLLPFARRIMRISYASILTSSSSSVRKVMDPTSAAQLEGKKRRWLHLSIASRAQSIQTFGRAMAAFGCDNSSKLSSSSPSLNASTDAEKAITLVVGSLVEQINRNKVQTGDIDDDWGTTTERAELVSASATCLNIALVSCGGFLSQTIRSLIESVLVDGLTKMGRQAGAVQILSWAPVKTCIIRLACGCVSTPWQDGASSGMVDLLTRTASVLTQDVDVEVSVAAKTALRLCETISVPRAPALIYVTRAVTAPSEPSITGETTDASSLAKSIESARTAAVETRKKMEEAEIAKKRKLEEKRQQQEEKEKARNAAKRQKSAEKAKKESEAAAPSNNTKHAAPAEPLVKENQVEQTKEPATATEASNETAPVDETVDEESVADERPTESTMETDDKSEGASMNNGSDNDDDDFPEIFDGGPDSDDE